MLGAEEINRFYKRLTSRISAFLLKQTMDILFFTAINLAIKSWFLRYLLHGYGLRGVGKAKLVGTKNPMYPQTTKLPDLTHTVYNLKVK